MNLFAYIKKIAVYLPETVVENTNEFHRTKIGIERRHIAPKNMTASDMAVLAAEKLFSMENFRKNIDYLIFCTQSPDYILPTTACIIQNRLGLRRDIGAVDVNMSCSGYIYSLGLAKGIIESGQGNNVLLLTAETYSQYIHEKDMSIAPLFGDAATATLISGEETNKSGLCAFSYGTDGRGADNFIIPVGGTRNSYEDTPVEENVDKFGNMRTNRNINMNGMAISNMVVSEVPKIVKKILSKENISPKELDYCVFHQANGYLLEQLRKICGLKDCAFWNNLKDCGNTVSNSLPLALNEIIEQNAPNSLKNIMLVGYGPGFSWGGCLADLSKVESGE